MFSIRLVTVDSYQAQPLPQLDPTYSVFRGCEIKNVPVIRVFGTTPTGEKTCLHVHGVFPYLYVPYTAEESEESLAYRLAAALDTAINISLGSAASTNQHVYQIQRVAGIPFYGYHRREHQFFKISFYNPAIMKKAADLLQTGAVLGESFQPHEAHLNYTLQFMIDYNLYGMSFINLSSIKYRRVNSSSREILSPYDNVISPMSDNNAEYLPASVLRQSICELEIDAIASDILNREDLAKGIELNPGLSAIWSEERERRRQAGLVGGDSQLVNPKSPPRPPFRPTDSDLYQEERLARRLLMISQCDESTLSMSTNSTPYPAEVSPGDVILNASNFGSSSTQTSDKTQRANETLSLSSLGSTQCSQTSHECSALDSDDLPLLELLENLARDSDIRDPVDEDSVLGTQRSGGFGDELEEDKSDNDDNGVNEDLNLTCLELEGWDPWEGAKRTAATTSFQNPDKSPVTSEDIDSTLLGALLAAGMDTDNSESQESAVPQLDGAGDLCSSILDSEEEENMQMQEGGEQLTPAYLQSQQVTLNDPSNPQSIPPNSSLSPSTSSTCSDGTSGSWSTVVSDGTYIYMSGIDCEDFVGDIENIMQLEMNFPNQTNETLASTNLIEDETIPIERVLNGDPCFTQTAELDKSDFTELQNQYVSLLDNELLTGFYENSENLDLINNTVAENTANSQVVGQTQGIVTQNVIQCVQQETDSKSLVTKQISARLDEVDIDNQNCNGANRLTSDGSDYNCDAAAPWEELQDLRYLSNRKRKSTRKLNRNVKRKMCRVAKSDVHSGAVASDADSSVTATVWQAPNQLIENETFRNVNHHLYLQSCLNDVRGAQYLPNSIGENESLLTPILSDFEELIDSQSSPINPPRFVSNYSSNRAHSGSIFGANRHRHGYYSFKNHKFLKNYAFSANEIWVIEKRKRGGRLAKVGVPICRDKYCRLPYVPLEKVNVEVVPSEQDENSVEAGEEVGTGVEEEENREDSNSINSQEDSASINDSTESPEEKSTCKDPNYVPPREISTEEVPLKRKNEKNTFTRITRQSERNFIQSPTSTESGDGPVIIRRVFEEKTNGSCRVKRRKIILKVGSNTDSQSDDSRIEEKAKVPVKMKRKTRLPKRNIQKIGRPGDSLPTSSSLSSTSGKNSPIFEGNVAYTNNKEKPQNRPRILCSIKTKRVGWKWLLSITKNQNSQSSLSASALKIRKIETLAQKYIVQCDKKENTINADVPQGKSITTLEQNGKVEEKSIPVTVIMPEIEEDQQQLDNLPELCGSIYRNDVELMSEELSSQTVLPLDKTLLSNDDTLAPEIYTTSVSDVHLYSGKDYTIDAVSQEIPQCLFEEDSNTSLNKNENTINMMSLKRSVDEIEANSTLDQSDNLSIKSFEGGEADGEEAEAEEDEEEEEEEEDQYSDHESGILSMADDSGSNSGDNNDSIGETTTVESPNSFRARLINELQKRCQRCERCDCNSYMSRLTQSTDAVSTGALRSEKIFVHGEKMNLVTKSIFRLIGESSEMNANASRISGASLEQAGNIDSEDDTLKDVSDRCLDSDIKSEEMSLNSTPKSSPKKISILRKIYSTSVESSHSDEASDCEKIPENRSKVQVNSSNDSVKCVDHEPSEKSGDLALRIRTDVDTGLQSSSNLSVIDDRKSSSKEDTIQDTTVSNNAQSGDSSDVERTQPLKTPESYLQIVLEEDNNGDLIIERDEESNCSETLTSSENEMKNIKLNISNTCVSNPLAITHCKRKSHLEIIEEKLIDKIPCVNDEVFSDEEISEIVINPLYKFRKNIMSQDIINESSLPIVRSEVVDINEDTRDTFIIEPYNREITSDHCNQNNSTVVEDVSIPDTVILEASADAVIDNKSSSKTLNIHNNERRAFNSINNELSQLKSVITNIREANVEDNTTPINLESRNREKEEEEKVEVGEKSLKGDRIEVTQAVEQNENKEKQGINHSPFELPNLLPTFIDHTEVLETSETLSDTEELSSSYYDGSSSSSSSSSTPVVRATFDASQENSPIVSSQDDTLSIQLSSTPEKLRGTCAPDSHDTGYDISFSDEIEFLSSPEPCEEDETINVIINNLNDDDEEEEKKKKEGEDVTLIENFNESKLSEPQALLSESTSESVELIIPLPKLPEDVPLIKPLVTLPKTLPNEFNSTAAVAAAAAAAAATTPLVGDLQTSKAPEGPSSIMCRGLSIKLERLSPYLVTKYLNQTKPLEFNEKAKVHRVKKNVTFSPDVLIFQTNEQVPLRSDSAEVDDGECSEPCKSKSVTKSTSLEEEMSKVSNEPNSEKSSEKEEEESLRVKVCESIEDGNKVVDKFQKNQITKSNNSDSSNNNNNNNNNSIDKSIDTNNENNSEELPKNSKCTVTSDNGISMRPDDTDITQQGQEVGRVLNDCTSVVEHEEKLAETCMEEVLLHGSLFEKEKDEPPKADIKTPEISTSESHESHPQHSVELRDKNPPKKSEVVRLSEFQVVQNFSKLEFSRRSKIPTKKARSSPSTSPNAAIILSPDNSVFNQLEPLTTNRYFKNYTLQSPCRIKSHTLSVDERLVVSKMSVRNAKVEGKNEKENFLYQLGLYPMNPQLFTWDEEISYMGYIQRQKPLIPICRLGASTLKRYGYTHRFKSNKLGKRFLTHNHSSNEFKIPAFDGPADLTSSESDDETTDKPIIEQKEKRVCRYNVGRAREVIVTPKKRKHLDSPEDEPQAVSTVKSLCVTPKRAGAHLYTPKPSTLKSPRGLSGNYTPLKIIITSPKVRRESYGPHESSSGAADPDNNPNTCLTPRRRKEHGLHENLLRGRISNASPDRCSGNTRSQEVDYFENNSRAGTSQEIIRTTSASEDEMRQERLSDIDSKEASTSIGMNVRKNLFTEGEEKRMKKSPTIILSPKASTSRGAKNSQDNNNSDENPKEAESSDSERTLLFDEEIDFHLKYSTLENTFLMDEKGELAEKDIDTGEKNIEDEEEDNLCNITFSQYIGSQLSKNTVSTVDKNQTQKLGDPERAVKIIPRFNPPTADRIKDTMESYGISKCRNPQPYFSKQADAPGQKELAHKMLKVPGKSLTDVAIFKSTIETITGINRWRKMKINEFHSSRGKIKTSSIRQSLAGHGTVIITPLLLPPALKSVKTWIKAREYLVRKKREEEKERKENYEQNQNEDEKIEDNNENPEASENTEDSSDSSIIEPSPEKIVHSNSLRILGRTPKIPQTANKALLFMPSSTSSSNTQSTNTSDKSMELGRTIPPDSSTSLEKSMNPSLMSMLEKSKLFRGTEHSKHHGISCGQIEGVSDSSTRTDIANENMQNAKAITTYQYITLMSVEVHVITRGDLLPDPEHDSISAIFYAIQRDVPPSSEKKALEHGVIAVAPEGSKKLGYSYGSNLPFSITLVPSESALFESFITLVIKTDPEIFIGWELESLSWGYIFQRAATFGVNLNKRISRIPGIQCKWEAAAATAAAAPDLDALGEIKLPGRVVLDIWKLMRHEMALLSYSFENVMYHVMNERIPCPSFKSLTNWWNSMESGKNRWKVVEHYGVRVLGVLRILEQLDIIGRTSELARLFGIQFYEVFTRGSQFRVESIMLRLAKPLNYIAVSPSMQQRAGMRAMEALPLIMEPESVFYSDPVIVLDFQSLYPSIIIAHNYCFSTCLGRIENIGQPHPFQFGAGLLKVTKNTALKIQGKVNYSPCGVAFVKEQVRQGILPRMLTEILETRFMVKKAMKDHDKNDKTLQRVLHSRQLGLKFLANVTYGYTAANFTGRMPCVEVGDSVVAKGKETLERAIKLVEETPKWGARVVYGDTDSLFILAPGKSKEDAFKIGYEIADAVTADNPKPIKLKFEKVLFPTILQTKKRYCGYMWESPEQEKPTYLAKGIETVRRDGCPAVSKILEKTLKILFDTKDVSQVKQYVVRQMDKILQGKVSIQDLTFAKEFRGLRGYKEKACVPALELTRRLMKRDPRALPRHGERVKYIIVAGAPNQALIHCVRSPWEVLNDPGLRPNAVYYVTRVIIPPLNRCLNLMGVDVNTWYKEMPHRHIFENPYVLPSDKQKQTIFQYFGNVVCAACGIASNRALCNNCQSKPTDTLLMLHEKLRWLERINGQVSSICQSCVGRGDTADCSSLDCPVLYRRAQAQRELTQGVQLERIIKEQTIDF